MNTLSCRKASRLGVPAGLVVFSVVQGGAALATQPADDSADKAAGRIKIHNVGAGENDNSNEPKVCGFTVVGDNVDEGDSVSWTIVEGPPFKDAPTTTGTGSVDSGGTFSSAVIGGHRAGALRDRQPHRPRHLGVGRRRGVAQDGCEHGRDRRRRVGAGGCGPGPASRHPGSKADMTDVNGKRPERT